MKRARETIAVLFFVGFATTQSHAIFGGGALSAAAIQKAMENALQKKMGDILKQTVGAKLSIGTTTSATANVSLQKQKIAAMVQEKLGDTPLSKTAADVVEGCLTSVFKQLGVKFKLPNVSLCGVNLTHALFSELAKDYKKHFSLWDVVQSKTPLSRVPETTLEKKDLDAFKKRITDVVKGGGKNLNGESLSKGSADVGEPLSEREKKTGSYAASGGVASTVKLSRAAASGGTPSYFDGTRYDPAANNYVNEMLNRAYAREMANEADMKKSELEILSVCDMTSPKITDDVKKNGKKSVAAAISVPFPSIARYTSDFQGKKLLSSRPDKKIFTSSLETVSLYDLLNASKGGGLVSSYVSAYKSVTGRNYKFIHGRVDYGKLSEMARDATIVSLNTIKMDGSEGKFLARMEMLKGILHQLVILNHQVSNENYVRMRILFRENNYMRRRLDELQNAVDMISAQITRYGKENLEILRAKK